MKRMNRISTVLGIVMLGLITGNILMLLNMKAAIEAGSAIQEWMGAAVAISLIVIALSHLIGLVNLVLHFKHFRNASIMRAAAFVIGVFSLFLLAVDVVMLSDIGNEYMFGYDTSGEWQIVLMGHFVHGLFAALLMIQCIDGNRRFSRNSETMIALKDESVFLTVHQTGIISAALGLLCLFLLTRSGVPQAYLSGLLFLSCIIILTPYGLAAAYWVFTKRKEKPADWYDEKLFADISRGALVTLVISVLITIVFYFLLSCEIIHANVVIWFPSYLFVTLLIFSGSTLYLSKRA